ncbi:MAG: hypothetical protein K9M57_11425 [Phycisphaerae bacterium]|nr:hypothetical protein [Phycisphaerae bacterium]
MKKTFTATLLVSIALTLSSCQNAPAKDALPVSHPFLCADYGGNMIWIVDKAGKVTWQFPAKRPQDVWQLPNGNILFSHVDGAIEVTRKKKIVWQYKAAKPNEVQSCQPLANGNTLVALSGPCQLLEITPKGKIVKTVQLTTGYPKNPHAQMRQVRQLNNGHYLVGHCSDEVIREYDANGKVINTIKAKGHGFGAIRLPNGNTLVATGDGHKLIEFDAKGKEVWKLNENDLPGNPLRFIAGVQRLPNGNTVVCNWGGHGHVGKQPQIFEVTPQKKVVWQIFDYKKFNTISNIQLLDIKGNVTKNEILR